MTICFVKSFTEFGGILFDYASERNDINYAPHTLPFGVLQRESHGSGSEGFAAARWYGGVNNPCGCAACSTVWSRISLRRRLKASEYFPKSWSFPVWQAISCAPNTRANSATISPTLTEWLARFANVRKARDCRVYLARNGRSMRVSQT